MVRLLLFLVGCFSIVSSIAFSQPTFQPLTGQRSPAGDTALFMVGGAATADNSNVLHLHDPKERDAHYGSPLNVAQYLVDLHDNKALFNFCGGMMFQLVLSDKLRDHLVKVAASTNSKEQPVIFDATKPRMFQINNYEQSGNADNIRLFHGREIRQVPHANGGMGFVLQLSLANGDDPEGWTPPEIDGYDGWGHDVGRVWRKGDRLEDEGFTNFRRQFGPKSFALNHRFYLHSDGGNRIWLSAEDGCEGTPAASGGATNALSNLFGLLGR